MPSVQRIVPFLWFDDQAEEAAELYTAVFPNSRILTVTRYGEAGKEIHGGPRGSVMTVAFELDGQTFTALNGGPLFKFTEAVSFQVECDTQAEIDHYWAKLVRGRRRAGPAVRLAQGPVRRLVAGRAAGAARPADRDPARSQAGHGGPAEDEEARPGPTPAGGGRRGQAMSEQPVPPADRPGVGAIVLTLVVTTVFAVRAVRWWLGVADGTTTTETMTTWGWVRLGVVHLGALGGPVVVARMVRDRLRPAAEPAPPPGPEGSCPS